MKKSISKVIGVLVPALLLVAAFFKVSKAEEGFQLSGYRRGVNIVVAGGSGITANVTNDVILVNVTTNTIVLPAATNMVGKEITIKLVAPAASGTVAYTNIDGATTYSLSASNKYVRLVSDGTNYWNVGNN